MCVCLCRAHLLGVRRCRQGPGAQVDEHHQQDRYHPLEQLLVGELHLVGGLDAVGERNAPRFHQQRRVGDAEAHVARPLGGDARVLVEYRKDGRHLQIHEGTTEQRDGEEDRAGHLEHLHLPVLIHVQCEHDGKPGAHYGEGKQRRSAKREGHTKSNRRSIAVTDSTMAW